MSKRRMITTLMTTAMIVFAAPTVARADVGTFSNPTTITIPDVGQASPYPSNIAVSGLNGTISDVNAALVNINHVNPDDIETLLVAPGGQTTVLMADAGGSVNSVNDTITLDDSATFPVPDMGGLVNGATHQPADYDMPGLEPYNAPAPPPPHGLTLSTSNGSNPNGTWSLYVFDDFFNTAGQAITGGWTLTITTVLQAPVQAPQGTCRGKAATIVGTANADTLTGTAAPDVIAALGGNDVVSGLNGKDVVCGDDGRDELLGGAGKDEMAGGGGKDTLKGAGGKDKLLGGAANDTLKGGGAKDTLKGAGGNDSLKGGGAKDTLKGGGGNDVCNGQGGDDSAKACETEQSI